MHLLSHRHSVLILAFAIAFTAIPAAADIIETRNGARLVGRIAKIDADTVTLDTDYAGSISVKRAEVASLSSDGPVSGRLDNGTRFEGRLAGGPGGTLRIDAPGAPLETTFDKLAATWPAGAPDPMTAVPTAWSFEAGVDIAGRTGSKEQIGTAGSLRATRKSATDTLVLSTAYDRQVTDNQRSADKGNAGADYQNNFSGRLSWYARDEAGFDRVRDVGLYNVAGTGFGYDWIKKPKHILTTRAGLSYRFETFRNPATADLKEAGLDLGFNHELEMKKAKLVNRLAWLPTFKDTATYRITHESFLEMPLADPFWKLRLGLSNEFNSEPGPGLEKLDTTYFTRLILTWR